jgi:hypothetical protein
MNPRMTFALAVLCLSISYPAERATAQSGKDLVGAWIAVSNTAEQGGVKSEPYGASPQGMLIFEPSGRYGLILSKKDMPNLASNNRTTGTPDENKAVVQGTIAHFGTYSINEADKSITFRIETSTFPNFNSTEQKRAFTLVGDELTYTVPSFSGGGTAVAKWKRAK